MSFWRSLKKSFQGSSFIRMSRLGTVLTLKWSNRTSFFGSSQLIRVATGAFARALREYAETAVAPSVFRNQSMNIFPDAPSWKSLA